LRRLSIQPVRAAPRGIQKQATLDDFSLGAEPETANRRQGTRSVLLRGLKISSGRTTWGTAITFVPMGLGFFHPVAGLAKPGGTFLAVAKHDGHLVLHHGLEEALAHFGKPEMFNTDQGSNSLAAPSLMSSSGTRSNSRWMAAALYLPTAWAHRSVCEQRNRRIVLFSAVAKDTCKNSARQKPSDRAKSWSASIQYSFATMRPILRGERRPLPSGRERWVGQHLLDQWLRIFSHRTFHYALKCPAHRHDRDEDQRQPDA
jgi:hypothetical protein